MKKNDILVSEYDMIGAELYYCYNYNENVNKIENEIYNLENKIEKIEHKTLEYSSKDILSKDINWGQYPEIQTNYKDYCENRVSATKNELNYLKKYKKIYNFLFVLIIILIMIFPVSLISLFLMELFKINSGGFEIVLLFPFIGIVLGVISIVLLTKSPLRKEREKIITSFNRNSFELKMLQEKKDSKYFESHKEVIRAYVSEKLSTEVVTIFRNNNPDFFSNLDKEKISYQNDIKEYKIILESIHNEFKENMSVRNTIIPSVYHNEEDITNLIDYYVRRRGDTWKELVNEYEHDKKLNQIISSINDLSQQVSVLTDSVVKCFNIVGMQLGIINESILSLQTATQINLNKISQIENQQEKRLCELTSSIQNMNSKTKIIIESK